MVGPTEDVFQSRYFKADSEVFFSKKFQKLTYPSVSFKNIPVKSSTIQKHLGAFLDEKLNFDNHILKKIGKASKEIVIIKQLFTSLLIKMSY